jgi:cytochrome c556
MTRPGPVHALVLSSAIAAGALSATAGGHQGLVDARRQAMKEMAAAAKTIGGMFARDLPYDRRQFIAAAETIRSRSGQVLVAQFPEATLGPPSEAMPSIATDPGEFVLLAGRLREYSSALAGKADDRLTQAMRMGGGDGAAAASSLLGRRASSPADVRSTSAEHVFHLMLQSCTACHARYREKR